MKSEYETLITAWRAGRPIVPFLGAGISQAAGFPGITSLVGYLAKLDFAISESVYSNRYPIVGRGNLTFDEYYTQHPAEFIADFGWPDPPQLEYDLWNWIRSCPPIIGNDKDWNKLRKTLKQHERKRKISLMLDQAVLEHSSRFSVDEELGKVYVPSDLLCKSDLFRGLLDSPAHIAQVSLARLLIKQQPGLMKTLKNHKPDLDGDWSLLLDRLTEGQPDLVDGLFSQLNEFRSPTWSHIYITALLRVLGVRLLLTTNFDSLLESTFQTESVKARIFDVHRDAALPHPRLVNRQLSLLKLHGSSYGLRYGEQLQTYADEKSKIRFTNYIPKNSMLVVVGFSGWERRIMQLIAEFAIGSGQQSNQTKVLWLTTGDPNKLTEHSPYLQQLKADLDARGLDAIELEHCRDAGSYFCGLYQKITSTFPPTIRRIAAFPTVSKTQLRSETSPSWKELKAKNLVLIDGLATANSENLPVLCKGHESRIAAFLSKTDSSRKTIWVDLENFHTIEGVVQEVIRTLRVTDPNLPRITSPISSDATDDEIRRVAARIREGLVRVPTLLVFDSLEHFSREQFVHHGFTNVEADCPRAEALARKVEKLKRLILSIVSCGKSPSFLGNSLVFATFGLPSVRHPLPTQNHLSEKIGDLLAKFPEQSRNSLGENALSVMSANNDFREQIETQKKFLDRFSSTCIGKEIETGNKSDKLEDNGYYKSFFLRCGALRSKIRRQTEISLLSSDYNINIVFLFCCVFRRARPIAVLRSSLFRWLFGSAERSDNKHSIFHASQFLEDAISKLESHEVLQTGDSGEIIIPRGVNETTYQQFTDAFRASVDEKKIQKDPHSFILPAILIANWHLIIARSYFTEGYLATRDQFAFFEYLYHRISGLRILKQVQDKIGLPGSYDHQAILAEVNNLRSRKESRNESDPIIVSRSETPNSPSTKRLQEIMRLGGFSPLFDALFSINFLNFIEGNSSFENTLIRIESEIKLVMDEIAEQKRNQSNESEEFKNEKKKLVGTLACEAIQFLVLFVRLEGVDTLTKAIARENQRISRSNAPENWLAWLTEIQENEMEKIFESPELQNPCFDCGDSYVESLLKINKRRESLASTLNPIRLQINNDRLDYYQSLRIALIELARMAGVDWDHSSIPTKQTTAEFLTSEKFKLLLETRSKKVAKKVALVMRYLLRVFFALGFVECIKAIKLIACRQKPVLETHSSANDLKRFEVQPVLKSVDGGVPAWLAINKHIANSTKNEMVRLKCEQASDRVRMWTYFDNALTKQESNRQIVDSQVALEKETYMLESATRLHSETGIEYARRRCHSFCLRSRSNYLRRNFRDAHRLLTEAEFDLRLETPSHRFARSVISLYRAELLQISAENHLVSPERIDGSIRKINSAMKYLQQAEFELEEFSHRPLWQIRLHTGFAQVLHDSILLEISHLEQNHSNKSHSTYTSKFLLLEERVLSALRSIRLGLDAIPNSNLYTPGSHKELSFLGASARKFCALFVQLFVAGYCFNHLLLSRLQLPLLGESHGRSSAISNHIASHERFITRLKDNRVNRFSTLMSIDGFLGERFEQWSSRRQLSVHVEILRQFSKNFLQALVDKPRALQVGFGSGSYCKMRTSILNLEQRFLDTKGFLTSLVKAK